MNNRLIRNDRFILENHFFKPHVNCGTEFLNLNLKIVKFGYSRWVPWQAQPFQQFRVFNISAYNKRLNQHLTPGASTLLSIEIDALDFVSISNNRCKIFQKSGNLFSKTVSMIDAGFVRTTSCNATGY